MGYVSFREGMLIDFPIGSGIPVRGFGFRFRLSTT